MEEGDRRFLQAIMQRQLCHTAFRELFNLPIQIKRLAARLSPDVTSVL
jgi:hypothetical protein